MYSTLEELNRLPAAYASIDDVRRAGGAEAKLALRDLEDAAARFWRLLESARSGASLAQRGLRRIGGHSGVSVKFSGRLGDDDDEPEPRRE